MMLTREVGALLGRSSAFCRRRRRSVCLYRRQSLLRRYCVPARLGLMPNPLIPVACGLRDGPQHAYSAGPEADKAPTPTSTAVEMGRRATVLSSARHGSLAAQFKENTEQ